MMTNLNDTIDYLRHIQKVFYEINGGYYDNEEQIKNIFVDRYSIDEKYISDYNRYFKKVNSITEYQNPRQYETIKKYVDLIEEIKHEVLDNEKILNRPIPVWGTVNMQQFSAQILPPQESIGNIILLSSGIMTYALLISKIIAKSFPITRNNGEISIEIDRDAIVSNIEKNPEIELRFIDLMLSYLLTGEPVRARQYMMEPFLNYIATPIIVGFECFIVAHEYSHYLLGHLDKKICNIKQIIPSNLKIEEIIHNWEDELSADTLGIKLAIKAIEESKLNRDLGLVGIFACLKSFDLFERLNSIGRNEDINKNIFSETHPPAISRIQNFMEILTKEGNVDYLILLIDTLINHLWDKMLLVIDEIGINRLLREKTDFQEINFKECQKKIYEYYSVDFW